MLTLFRNSAKLESDRALNTAMSVCLDSPIEVQPNARIAYAVLKQALREQAREIVIAAQSEGGIVRYCIAQEWRHTMTLPPHVKSGVVEHLKLMAGLDILDTRRRQQGVMLFSYENTDYDAYLSCLPTRYGERVHVTLFPQSDPPALPNW